MRLLAINKDLNMLEWQGGQNVGAEGGREGGREE